MVSYKRQMEAELVADAKRFLDTALEYQYMRQTLWADKWVTQRAVEALLLTKKLDQSNDFNRDLLSPGQSELAQEARTILLQTEKKATL